MPTGLASLYRVFQVADVAMLAAGLIGVVVWLPESPVWAAAVLAIWVFAVIEYLNYFVVRLSYPPRRWFGTVTQWRTPRLVQDLRDSRQPD